MPFSDKILAFRGKAPALPLEPLSLVQNDKTNLKMLNQTPDKEQHIWGMRSSFVLPALATTLVLGVIMLVVSALLQPDFEDLRQSSAVRQLGLLSSGHPETLVLYTYSNSDPEYERNLHFFVQYGMAEGDGCDYLIVVQQGNKIRPSQKPLPDLPSNAQYVFHDNLCYDWGTFGWALGSSVSDISSYSYFVFLNSSVRGPHLPAYWPKFVHWSSILTSRLAGKVKLVGSTISCEGTFLHGNVTAVRRQNPHVQSYVMATDQEGLEILQEDGLVFKCYESLHDTVWNSELGSSVAIFKAGYTIDSLMLKYQGADWTNLDNWNCNAGLNPYAADAYDGINLNPLEVVFVKVKGFLLQADWPAPKTSQTYDRWLSHQGEAANVQNNEYAAHTKAYRAARISQMVARGSDCFNFELYRAKNSLPFEDGTSLWDHFVQHGQFEGRTFEFKCWQAGRRSSPVDGQWYPGNASSSSTVPASKKSRLSVHLKLPKNRLQWKLQEQLQQKLDAHPELADAVQSQDPALSRQLLHNQSTPADAVKGRDPALFRQLLQNQSAPADAVQIKDPSLLEQNQLAPEPQSSHRLTAVRCTADSFCDSYGAKQTGHTIRG